MKRIWLVILAVLTSACFLVSLTVTAQAGDLKMPEDEIIIEGEKKSARFSHPVHQKLGAECGQCHHDTDQKPLTEKDINAMENSLQLQCASCHNKEFPNPKLNTVKAASHARCKECHKKGVDGKKGPTKCTGCHVKK